MLDRRFYPPGRRFAISELAEFLEAEIRQGDGNAAIDGIASLSEAGETDVGFFESAKYKADLISTNAGAVLMAPDKAGEISEIPAPLLVVENPYKSFALAAQKIFPDLARLKPVAGVQAEPIHPDARIGENVEIGPGAVIGADAEIGDGCSIGAGAIIGHGCVLGRGTVVGSQSVLQYALVGDGVHIHPNASIGQDGFGYAPDFSGHVKIPHLGRVIIQNDVSIGSSSTLDRGTLDDTVIGEGTKIDNQVHIAHNVKIGRHCFIAAQFATAGSAVLEDNVMIAGMVGVNGHITIGRGASILGYSAVYNNVPAGQQYLGNPAQPAKTWRRQHVFLKKLFKKSETDRGA